MESVGVGGYGVAFSAQLLKPHEVAWIPASTPVPSKLLDLFPHPTHHSFQQRSVFVIFQMWKLRLRAYIASSNSESRGN